MRDTADHDRAKEEETDQDIELLKATRSCAEPNNSFPETVAAAIRREDASKKKPDPVTPFKFQSGGRQAIALEQNLKEKYLDEYTREVLPPDLMKEAIRDELAWLNEHVWEGVPMDEVKLQPDAIVVGTRWVMCNKGDIANPDMRARLVAQEVAHEREDSYFAAPPPLEAKRALISQMASERTRGGVPLKISLVDVRKAYFNGIPTRNLYVRLPPELGLPRTIVGKLKRCLYGTRDAGHIWEAKYGDELVKMGFIQGKASPCCFHHPTWLVSLVVHGDDFTALGTDKALQLFEDGMAAAFEIKCKGRLGPDPGDCKELRVLNRILRMTDEGVSYEADPRHAEHLIKSLGLSECRYVSTPGTKSLADDPPYDKADQEVEELIASLNHSPDHFRERRHKFSTHDDVIEIEPYSSVYGMHPRQFVIAADDHNVLSFLKIKKSSDPYTGRSNWTMSKRRQEAAVHPDQRRKILEHVLANGAAWEMPTAELVCVISKKKKKFEQKRMGAKVVKAAERLLDSADILTGEAATTYRALSARLNYLASDRPDLAFSAKELCRDFAQPTAKSVERLKRAVRYLRHRPRLIWLYKWQEPVKHLVAFCDTDVAGCVQTRRSTSGGALMRGGHLIRHWSQTQTTVALSSAEAELGGICRGSTHGI